MTLRDLIAKHIGCKPEHVRSADIYGARLAFEAFAAGQRKGRAEAATNCADRAQRLKVSGFLEEAGQAQLCADRIAALPPPEPTMDEEI